MEATTPTLQTPPLFSGQRDTKQAQKTAALSSDFETFLKMLTVQMENQDPLNPVDSADYAVQLATFSSVEQQVRTNDLLSSLAATMASGGIESLGQWVNGSAWMFAQEMRVISMAVTSSSLRPIIRIQVNAY